MAVCSAECEKEVPGARRRGADQILAWRSALWEAFPGIQLIITRVVEEGSASPSRAGLRERIGERCGRPPETSLLRTDAWDIMWADDYEVRGGVIDSTRLHFDRLEMLEQLGVAPAPAPRSELGKLQR